MTPSTFTCRHGGGGEVLAGTGEPGQDVGAQRPAALTRRSLCHLVGFTSAIDRTVMGFGRQRRCQPSGWLADLAAPLGEASGTARFDGSGLDVTTGRCGRADRVHAVLSACKTRWRGFAAPAGDLTVMVAARRALAGWVKGKPRPRRPRRERSGSRRPGAPRAGARGSATPRPGSAARRPSRARSSPPPCTGTRSPSRSA